MFKVTYTPDGPTLAHDVQFPGPAQLSILGWIRITDIDPQAPSPVPNSFPQSPWAAIPPGSTRCSLTAEPTGYVELAAARPVAYTAVAAIDPITGTLDVLAIIDDDTDIWWESSIIDTDDIVVGVVEDPSVSTTQTRDTEDYVAAHGVASTYPWEFNCRVLPQNANWTFATVSVGIMGVPPEAGYDNSGEDKE